MAKGEPDDQSRTPAHYHAVARLRNADARALQQTGDDDRAMGAIYLAGFVVECMLKAELIKSNPWLSIDPPINKKESQDNRELRRLCFRSHELIEIVAKLPNIENRLLREKTHKHQTPKSRPGRRKRKQVPLALLLQNVCAQWTVNMRYSTRRETSDRAGAFIDMVEEIRRCLE